MKEIKNEILLICELFKLGEFKSSHSKIEKNGFVLTEFETDKGTYRHFYKPKPNYYENV